MLRRMEWTSFVDHEGRSRARPASGSEVWLAVRGRAPLVVTRRFVRDEMHKALIDPG
jgi:hypothetical protein